MKEFLIFTVVLWINLTVTSCVSVGRYEFSPAKPWSFSSHDNLIEYVSPFFEEDLSEPGAFLYQIGTSTEYKSSWKFHIVKRFPDGHIETLAGSNETYNPRDLNISALNQEVQANEAKAYFPYYSTQLNSTHIVIPELYRNCIRILDRTAGVVKPFIGQCMKPRGPQRRDSGDAASYTIRYPFQLASSPKKNKLYILTETFLFELNLRSMVVRLIMSPETLSNYHNRNSPARIEPFFLLTSNEEHAYVKTTFGLLKVRLPINGGSITQGDMKDVLSTQILSNYGLESTEDPKQTHYMRWLKQDQVIVISSKKSSMLVLVDVIFGSVSAFCKTESGALITSPTNDSLSQCVDMPGDIMLSTSNNTLIITYDNTTQVFYTTEYSERRRCEEVVIDNSMTALFQYERIVCDSGYYLAGEPNITCLEEGTFCCMEQPVCLLGVPLDRQTVNISYSEGPISGGYLLTISGIYPAGYNTTLHINNKSVTHTRSRKELSFIMPTDVTSIPAVVDIVLTMDNSSSTIPFRFTKNPELPAVITVGISYDIEIAVNFTLPEITLYLQDENSSSSSNFPARQSNCDYSDDTGNVKCTINFNSERWAALEKATLLMNVSDHTILTKTVQLKRRPTLEATLKWSNRGSGVDYTIVGEHLDQSSNSHLYSVTFLGESSSTCLIPLGIKSDNIIKGYCSEVKVTESSKIQVRFGNEVLYTYYLTVNPGINSRAIDGGGAVDKTQDWAIPVAVIVILVVLIVSGTMAGVFCYKRKMKQQTMKSIELKTNKVYFSKDHNGELFIHIKAKVSDMLIDSSTIVSTDSLLGEGNFGEIFKGRLLTDGAEQIVALKTLKDDTLEKGDIDKFLDEARLMYKLHHKHVLSALGVYVHDTGKPSVVLPYMANGDLKHLLERTSMKLSVGDLLHIGLQISKGMSYLSSRGFIHRDLAARNCLVSGEYVVKVADFGLSRDLYRQQYYKINENSPPLPVKWMAIESLEHGTFTSASDVWSFGVVLWELFTRGGEPYADIEPINIKRYLQAGYRLDKPKHCAENIYKFMKMCWLEEPSSRPTFEALECALRLFLKGGDDTKSDYHRLYTKELTDDITQLKRSTSDVGLYVLYAKQRVVAEIDSKGLTKLATSAFRSRGFSSEAQSLSDSELLIPHRMESPDTSFRFSMA